MELVMEAMTWGKVGCSEERWDDGDEMSAFWWFLDIGIGRCWALSGWVSGWELLLHDDQLL